MFSDKIFMHVSVPRMGRKIPSDKMTSILPPNNFCWYPVNTEIITLIALSQFFLISLLSFRLFCSPWNPLTISSPSPLLIFLNFLYFHVLSVCQIVAGKPLVVPQSSLLGYASSFFFFFKYTVTTMQTPLKYFSTVLAICLILVLCMQKLDRTFTWLFSRHQTKITVSLFFSNNLKHLLIQGLHIFVEGCGSHTALSSSPDTSWCQLSSTLSTKLALDLSD